MSQTRKGRFTGMLAILAVIAISILPFMPGLAGKGASFIQICTSSGIKLIAASGDDLPPGHNPDLEKIRHCPLCILRTLAFLSPLAEPSIGLSAQALVRNDVKYQPVHIDWNIFSRIHNPRAPPAFC